MTRFFTVKNTVKALPNSHKSRCCVQRRARLRACQEVLQVAFHKPTDAFTLRYQGAPIDVVVGILIARIYFRKPQAR